MGVEIKIRIILKSERVKLRYQKKLRNPALIGVNNFQDSEAPFFILPFAP